MLQRCLSWISLCVIYWNLLETVRGKAIREDLSAQPFEEISVFLDDDDVIHYTVENDPAVTVKTNAEDESCEETDHQVLRRVKQIDVETNTIPYDDTVLNEIVVSGNAATEAEETSSSSSSSSEEEEEEETAL